MSYSVIIKNGTIVDGTGSPVFLGDIGIKKDIISKIGDLSQEKADFVLLCLRPGLWRNLVFDAGFGQTFK